jgi:hypothetical protein
MEMVYGNIGIVFNQTEFNDSFTSDGFVFVPE